MFKTKLTAYSAQLTVNGKDTTLRFEKVLIWKRSKNLAVEVYRETKSLNDFGYRDQITRACLSISSNIAEGLERQSDKEKRYFLAVAKGSLAEFKSQTFVGADIGYFPENVSNRWLKESEELAAMVSSFMKTLIEKSSES